MAKAVLEEAKEWTVLPEGTIITVKVLSEETETQDGKYGPWVKLNVAFEIIDAPQPWSLESDVIGSKIFGGIPFKFIDDPNNLLKNWSEAILGFELDGNLGFELDTADWVGRKCRAVVRNFTKRNGKVGHGIDALLPLGGGQTAAPEDAARQLVEAQAQVAPAPPSDTDVPF
jgi:hypothetical protein